MSKKEDLRKYIYTFLIYPDSVRADWKTYLESLMIPIVVSPLHDKDILPTGEIKKPHYHVIIEFSSKKSWEQVHDITEPIGAVLAPITERKTCASWVSCKRTAVRYLCHLDSPDKAQYDHADVLCFGGFDYWSTVQSASNRYDTIRQIIIFCRQNCIDSFADLLDYCVEKNEAWYMTLCDSGVYIVKEYLKSKTWTVDRARKANFKESNKNDN